MGDKREKTKDGGSKFDFISLHLLNDTIFRYKIMNIKNITEDLLTVKEAAELLKVTEVTKRYIAKDIIFSVKIGGARRIVKGDEM
ncbi:MAG: helix-turn-helix domain-containing protein [Fibrobacter sp.]|jgi:hypothetical protein|nr:helix-turn-helix domain-containing protein [Fibrobacter sp.]